MFPGRLTRLAGLLLLIVGVTVAAGGGVACGIFTEISDSELATSEVGTLGTGAWLDVLGPGTSPLHADI